MRLPFFPRKPSGPIRIPLPQMLNIGFGIYFSPGTAAPPDPEALKSVILAWIDAHAEEPIGPPVRAFIERGLLNVQIGPRSMIPAPPMELLASIHPGETELRRFREATHLAVVHTSDLMVHPRIGFWSAIAAARAVARSTGGVILDPEIPRLVSLETLDEPLPANAHVDTRQETIVPVSMDRRGLLWMTTKGMSKFGLPEIEICDAPADLQKTLGTLVNGLTQHLLARVTRQAIEQKSAVAELTLPEELRIGVADFAHDQGHDPQPLGEGVQGWTLLRLEYRPGKRGASDFLRLLPPPGYRGNHGVWLHGMLTDLFGLEGMVSYVKADDEEMEIAHRRAVEELPGIRDRYRAGLPPGQVLYVKHGFPVSEGNHEWMWVVVTGWKGERIAGTLANDPQYRKDLRAGQPVELTEPDVYDWMLAGPGEQQEGGYTTAVLMRRS